jgi:hypothetical protein
VGTKRHIFSRRGRGNVGIPKGFPKSVGRVGSRLHGFPCFPYSVISMACFSLGKCWINDMPPPTEICRSRHEMLIGTDRLSLSTLAIYHSSRGRLCGKCIQFVRQAGFTSKRTGLVNTGRHLGANRFLNERPGDLAWPRQTAVTCEWPTMRELAV